MRTCSVNWRPAAICGAVVLASCQNVPPPERQKWFDITPDITASLKYGVDGGQYELGGVTDYRSPALSQASTLIYVRRQGGTGVAIPIETATNVAAKFANVAICESGGAKLTVGEPPVFRGEINAWAVALDCS